MTPIEKHRMCSECLNDTWMEITKVRGKIEELIIEIKRKEQEVKSVREKLDFVITDPQEGGDDMDMALFSIYAEKVIDNLQKACRAPMMTPNGLA